MITSVEISAGDWRHQRVRSTVCPHFPYVNKKVWDYVNQFTEFNNYISFTSDSLTTKGSQCNLPFNAEYFLIACREQDSSRSQTNFQSRQLTWKMLDKKNLEEQAIRWLIRISMKKKLIKGYTEKQWGRSATDLPPFIIKRLNSWQHIAAL